MVLGSNSQQIPRHKVFISYHHANDQGYKDQFVRILGNAIVDWSVRDKDIPDGLATETIRQKIRDEYLRDSTVTVVLIGAETWKRKHVDWEIGASLRDTQYNPRSGLLGVLLPTYPGYAQNQYDRYTIPPRLADNLKEPNPFARIYLWTEVREHLAQRIHDAFVRRDKMPQPDNSRDSFGHNRSGDRWFE